MLPSHFTFYQHRNTASAAYFADICYLSHSILRRLLWTTKSKAVFRENVYLFPRWMAPISSDAGIAINTSKNSLNKMWRLETTRYVWVYFLLNYKFSSRWVSQFKRLKNERFRFCPNNEKHKYQLKKNTITMWESTSLLDIPVPLSIIAPTASSLYNSSRQQSLIN